MTQLLHSNLRVQRALRASANRLMTFGNFRSSCAQILDIDIRELPPEALGLFRSDPAGTIAETEAFDWRTVDQRFENAYQQRRVLHQALLTLRKARRCIKPRLARCEVRARNFERLVDDGNVLLDDLKQRYHSQASLLHTVEELQHSLMLQFEAAYSETSQDYPEVRTVVTGCLQHLKLLRCTALHGWQIAINHCVSSWWSYFTR